LCPAFFILNYNKSKIWKLEKKMLFLNDIFYESKMAEETNKLPPDWNEYWEKSKQEWAEIRQLQKERDAKIDKDWKKLYDLIGGIGDSNGDVAEEAIYNVLEKDMTFANVKFNFIRKNVQLQSEDHRTLTELDVLMVNGDTVSLIETKYKVKKKDVTKLLKDKLVCFRQVFPKYDNHKIILGIGGMAFEENVLEEAKENGIGIIKIVGDKVEYYIDGIKVY